MDQPSIIPVLVIQYLHSHDAPEGVECGVGDVEAAAVATSHDHNDHVDRDDVDDEHVASPGGNHVEVRQGLFIIGWFVD